MNVGRACDGAGRALHASPSQPEQRRCGDRPGRAFRSGGGAVPKLRVFVVDDQEVVRRAVTDLLNEADGLTVIGQASVTQALARVPAL